jgi:hypothetical protein
LDGSNRAPTLAENILGSVFNATVSLLNSKWAHEVHPGVRQAVDFIKRMMNEDMPVHMVVHSQGSIVASNALTILKQESTPEEWAKISEMVRVESVGAVQLRFPDGPEVRTRVYKNDPFYYLGQAIADAKDRIFKEDLVLPSRGSLTELDGSSHDFDVCAATMHQFLIKDALGPDRSADAGKRLATTFIEGVVRADHADAVYLRLMDAMVVMELKPEYSEVVKTFKDEIRELFPSGRVGKLSLLPHHRNFLGLPAELH